MRHGDQRQDIAGACTFEYACCPSPYLLRDRPLPFAAKLPLDFFTYQIINLDDGQQLLMVHTTVLSRPLLTAVYLRSASDPGRALQGGSCQVAQFSSRSPSMRSNSRRLLVTSTSPSLRACPAICRSLTPMGVPLRSRSARMSP